MIRNSTQVWCFFLANFLNFMLLTSCSVVQESDENEIIDLEKDFISGIIKLTEIKQEKIIVLNKNTNYFPEYIENGEIFYVRSQDWTSGFYPGILWELYSVTDNVIWKDYAKLWTETMLNSKPLNSTHDLGFMILPSVYRGYELTEKISYRNYTIESADSLLSRYDPNIKLIKSWDNTRWGFPVIIDSMVNMELLFIASILTNDPSYSLVAINHIESITKSHIRSDGSVRHVVDFDLETGQIKEVSAGQGLSPSSTWSRGQAWSILGYALAYNYTEDLKYLENFEIALTYYLNNLPEDGMPLWDFKVSVDQKSNKDSSAGYITIYALLRMSILLEQSEKRNMYITHAFNLLNKAYRNGYISIDENYPGLTLHSIGHRPRSKQVDVTLFYSDYYLLKSIVIIKENYEKDFSDFLIDY